MSLTTYGGLKTSLAAWASNTALTTTLDDFVSWADQEIARRLRANVLLASTQLTLSAETIAQPTGFLAIRRMYLNTTSPRYEIMTTSPEGAMAISSDQQGGTYPSHVAVEGSLLRFAPLHTGTTTTATLLYYKRQTAMSADADTNVVLTAYPYLYLFGALEALFLYQEDDNMADRYGGKFGALIEDINNRDAKDMMSGPIQTRSYPGGVV